MKVSMLTLAAALTLGGISVALPDAADAQRVREAQRQQAQRDARQGQGQVSNLSREESQAIQPLLQAVQGQNWDAARAALPAAEAGAQSAYARYVVGQLRYELGRGTDDQALQAAGIEAMLASGGAPEDQIRPLLSNQVAFALRANDFAAAERTLNRLIELDPNDVNRLRQLAEVRIHLNRRAEAAQTYQRIIQITEAAGQQVPEDTYRRALALAYEARDRATVAALSGRLLAAYPNAENLRNSVLLYREAAQADGVLNLDIRRFMRAAQLLREEGEYLELADALRRGGLPGEVRAVLDEGAQRNVLNRGNAEYAQLNAWANENLAEDRGSLPQLRSRAQAGGSARDARTTADALVAYGQYAEAAELYRLALQRGGEDADLVNLRLGAALAQAGQRAAAEAALRAVTGQRAELAGFWLAWLQSR